MEGEILNKNTRIILNVITVFLTNKNSTKFKTEFDKSSFM